MLKILCVCNCVLGNRTFTAALKRVVDEFDFVKADYVLIDPKDYSTYPAPKWRRLSMTAETFWVIGQKLQQVNVNDYDLVIAQGFEIAWILRDRCLQAKVPCIMFNDATPTISHHLILKYRHEILWKIRSLLFIAVYKIFFRRIFSHVSHCFPRTSWCGRSLIHDFGVRPDSITVCPPNLDLMLWRPAGSFDSADEVFRLLFVGNDFERKGGWQAVKIYECLHRDDSRVCLRIVSNDADLEKAVLPEGVEHLKNIPHDELPRVFQESDIFVFPTLKEHLGLVQAEAAACGLPIVSRDIGGIADVVKDGHNGYLMPYDSSEDAWVEKIQYLIDHPEERARMGANSRKLAEEMFSMERFEKIVRDVVLKLTADKQ